MRATPYICNGDEIGMASIRFTDIGEYRDLMTINDFSRLKKEGGEVGAFLRAQAFYSEGRYADGQ